MLQPPSKVLILCGLVGALAATACKRAAAPATSGPAAGQAPAAGSTSARVLDPCRLLSEAEAGAFLGGPAKAAPSDKLPSASSCVWEARAPLRGLIVMTSTPAQLRADEALRAAGADTIDKRFGQFLKSHLADGKGSPVDGLGDAALWTGESAQLVIVKKDAALVIVAFRGQGPTADALDKCKAVAAKVMARI